MATGTPEVGSQSQWNTVGVTKNSDSKDSRGNRMRLVIYSQLFLNHAIENS